VINRLDVPSLGRGRPTGEQYSVTRSLSSLYLVEGLR
jgi:hypothetical protein